VRFDGDAASFVVKIGNAAEEFQATKKALAGLRIAPEPGIQALSSSRLQRRNYDEIPIHGSLPRHCPKSD